jgi:hypothetical protein
MDLPTRVSVSSAVVAFWDNAYIGEYWISYFACEHGEHSPKCSIHLATSYWFIGELTELQLRVILDQANGRQTLALVSCGNKHGGD